MVERFFGSLKSEWSDARRYLPLGQARRDVIHYIELEYNSDHFHSSLGILTPRKVVLAAAV